MKDNMNALNVKIEINGQWQDVGKIRYNTSDDASFSYEENYVKRANNKPISISLPIQEESFNPQKTELFFNALLPEGFTREAIVSTFPNIHNDYISLLKFLGSECLGALIVLEDDKPMPKPDYKRISKKDIKILANEGVSKSAECAVASHLSLDGASGKVGLYFDKENDTWYQPLGTAPCTHIVKQSHVKHKHIVINEQLCMKTAELIGLDVPNSFIVNTGSGNDKDLLFASQRYDRKFSPKCITINKLDVPLRLHQEDFAQAMNVKSNSNIKYDPDGNYFEGMCNVARNYCTEPMRAVSQIFDISIFNWLIGNADGHIKNFSILYSEDLAHRNLAPAYDIVSAYCLNDKYVEAEDANFAFVIDGKRKINEISANSFLGAARNVGISETVAKNSLNKIANKFEASLKQAAKILKDEGYAEGTAFAKKILSNSSIRKLKL